LISKFDLEGKPTVMLPEDATVVKVAEKMFDRIFGDMN